MHGPSVSLRAQLMFTRPDIHTPTQRALHVSADDLKLFFDVMSGLCLGSVGQSLCSAEATDALAEMFKK